MQRKRLNGIRPLVIGAEIKHSRIDEQMRWARRSGTRDLQRRAGCIACSDILGLDCMKARSPGSINQHTDIDRTNLANFDESRPGGQLYGFLYIMRYINTRRRGKMMYMQCDRLPYPCYI